MKIRESKTLRYLVGWILLALGLLGLALPILPGFLFLVLGIYLLAPFIPAFARLHIWLHQRWPALAHRLAQWRARH